MFNVTPNPTQSNDALRYALLAKQVPDGQDKTMGKSEDKKLEIKLNWLRAAVLGANDGIVSVAGVVMGVAAAGVNDETVLVAGVAALVAGAISMGGGEYVSVSSQRDAEISHGRGQEEITAHPWAAAWSSLIAFTAGASLPLIAILGPWQEFGIQATIAGVVFALALTGWWAAWAGKTPVARSILRNVSISVLTMGISYAIGALLGVTVL